MFLLLQHGVLVDMFLRGLIVCVCARLFLVASTCSPFQCPFYLMGGEMHVSCVKSHM